LWEITIPINADAATVLTTLDWTNTSYPIRATAFNGVNGAPGAPGAPGEDGADGTSGSSTFVVTRSTGTQIPTNAEVFGVIGRNPVNGDIVTVTATGTGTSQVYRFIAGNWAVQTTYITGSLIVQNTITASNMVANTITAASGIIADLAITTAKIGTAQVDTLQIAGNAVTVPAGATIASNQNRQNFNPGTIFTHTVLNVPIASSGFPTWVSMNARVITSFPGTAGDGSGNITVRLVSSTDGVIRSVERSMGAGSGEQELTVSASRYIPAGTSAEYAVQVVITNNAVVSGVSPLAVVIAGDTNIFIVGLKR
jgi:hypothetical protein